VLLLKLSRSNPSLKGPDSHRLFFAFGLVRRECLLAPSGRRRSITMDELIVTSLNGGDTR